MMYELITASLKLPKPPDVKTIIICILQTRSLRHKKVNNSPKVTGLMDSCQVSNQVTWLHSSYPKHSYASAPLKCQCDTTMNPRRWVDLCHKTNTIKCLYQNLLAGIWMFTINSANFAACWNFCIIKCWERELGLSKNVQKQKSTEERSCQ